MPDLTPKLGIKKPLGNETVSRAAFNENWDIIDANVVADKGGVPSIQAGADANKPAPGTAGRLYVATDTQIIYRDTGTAWQKVGVVKWGDIEGKPASFPPSAHTHAGSDITSKVASASAADTVPWSGVSGKPSSFTPSAHKSTHATSGADALTPADIGAAPSSHTHSPSQISPQGAGSGLDADLVRGRDVIANLENLGYDLYLLWLEQYYLGEVAGGPSPSGAKAIMFDGFMDASNLDAYGGTLDPNVDKAILDDFNRRLISPYADLFDNVSYTITQNDTGSAANMIDNNLTTYAQTSSSYTTHETIFDFGTQRTVKQMLLKLEITAGGGRWTLYGSNDGTNWTQLYQIEDSGLYSVVSINQTYRYWRVKHFTQNGTVSTYELELRYGYRSSAYALSKTKLLAFSTKRIKVYLSDKRPTNTDVKLYASNNGGTTWVQAGSPLSSRTDPKFSAYTEREYEIAFPSAGTQLKLKFELTSSDGVNTPEIKRYGVYIFEE